MSISDFGALVRAKPDEAKQRILDALLEVKGDRRAAAKKLEITHRSLYRFVERLRIWSEIDEMAKANKFPRTSGPPRSSKRIRDALVASEGSLVRAARMLKIRVVVLQKRIVELDLTDELNSVLKAAGIPTLTSGSP